ncbi:MAG: alkaline phosphatase family protein [Acidobacteriota bacterium]|nr:MAG: alkaline phosphatase family protein [Acidobacteriota bacterium]
MGIKKVLLLAIVGALGLVVAIWLVGTAVPSTASHPKMVILGVDGLDPRLLQEFVAEGELPNFEKFIQAGNFSTLETTMPPLSPVAWSSFISGMSPGGHGIYDFIHRDPQTMIPELSMSKAEPSDWTLELGSYSIPLSGGKIEQLRKGKAFWQMLEEEGIPTTVFRIPANFPPVESPGRSFSGMGTPDIRGTSGTFSFYTDDPGREAGEVSGGEIFRVAVEDFHVSSRLVGPENTFRKLPSDEEGEGPSHPKMQVGFDVYVDPDEAVAKFVVQDDEFILKEGEWSDWVRVDFEALPYVVGVSAIGRFYLQQVRPYFKLYLSPLQISPEDPAMPLSTPEDWAEELFGELGNFYTQELPEDTKAYSAGIFSGQEFWEQSQFVYRENRRIMERLFDEYEEGLLFFYFSSVDQGCHMLWRDRDPEHPYHPDDLGLKDAIRTLYQEIDDSLGYVMDRIDEDTILIVMSDHGFAPFYWGVNLNSWLLHNGYAALLNPRDRDDSFFLNVDWNRTRAYALGLNGIYLNLKGRERQGMVDPGESYERLLSVLERDLLNMVDPRTGRKPVSLVTRPSRDFAGSLNASGPDLIVGYSWGYRSSWESPLGAYPLDVFIDNADPWSGDHSMDSREVPGVLLTNLKITTDRPALTDLTVGVLDEFGIAPLPEMIGEDCLGR